MGSEVGDRSGGKGVGARLQRREDERYLRGRGRFVGDIRLPGMLELAFVRSPVAHARVRRVAKPAEGGERVFAAADLTGVSGIRADSGLPGFRSSVQPILAGDKVRHVGEPLAACLAETRALAEDLAERVELDLEELPAVHDMLRARDPGAPLLHEHWDENAFLESAVEVGFEAAVAGAAAVVRRTFRTARQCMAPIEGRGCVAVWDRQLEQLTLHSATQMPHIVRTGLAGCLGLDHGQVRVVAPDVGGGFGYKGVLLGEEVCAAWLAMKLDRPVRWLEDRREALTGGANCREHHYEVVGYAAADGELLAVDCRAIVDSGAYSIYPFSACLEAAQVASILPGPYRMRGYRCRTWSVCTNKPPILPFRGVARTGVCFAMELTMDALARELKIGPEEIRRLNLATPEEMPFTNITNKYFDSGDYPEALRRAVEAIDLPGLRARQRAQDPAARRRLGVGFSIFCEQGAHGTSVYHGWGIPMVPGFEQATARLTPDGGLELRVGVQSHGQGMETTLAQVAYEELGVDPAKVKLVHGDTALTPYSTGTWGSRCAVMAGGAVAAASAALAGRVRAIAGHLLQARPDEVVLADGVARAGGAEVSIEEIARTWYLKPQLLPPDADPRGLEATEGYKTARDTGTFSYACHAVTVEVDLDLGQVRLLDYAIVEDAGTMINPMVVDGQVLGGTVQGIGTALFEEMPFDAAGQPLASTLADYHLPVASDIPAIRILHMETPSPLSRFGQKGIGESGAIGPPAAIANAVNDALATLGAEVAEIPLTPERVLRALAAAEPRRA
ncbi:xanthine dehydrogenase, molybdenum binding subunit apoprotein [Tistlia consotensis]|uniref:Xanthine dehydrogenase, molybdenum binding subunit apoprotein n=1 Tax=Tistlia consotensis USBA 355 TaxID=560819 RepID=A0A1Y6C6T6_9PROT|nr:xanthine dehydrogenase family protein molybdopterin-binding subunit [Tistlia consotensis]SMF37239.1 xanthine dehydrogenase, molybdenum binding subunit apoprotein [Tistlia consotensis USBA 355]SNR72585.1 xanthine dehydrogenase, molybdenum binding subunit apoprotein [Tistlia consotensis]